jgi:hypothetical protein
VQMHRDLKFTKGREIDASSVGTRFLRHVLDVEGVIVISTRQDAVKQH